MQKLYKQIRYPSIVVCSFAVVFLFATQMLYAAPFSNPISAGSLVEFLKTIVQTIVYIVTPFIVLMMIYTGFLFVQAQGNPAKLTEAKTSLMWTLIGTVLVLGAFGLLTILENTVNNIV